MPEKITFAPPESGIFTPDVPAEPLPFLRNVPINGYRGYLRPTDDADAVARGKRCAEEIRRNFIADFERSDAYCLRNRETNPDRMVHVSTFTRLDGIIYMTYYANIGDGGERPESQAARFAFCPEDNTDDLTVVDLQKVGDTLDGEPIRLVYDTILMRRDEREIYLMWTAATSQYYRFYRVYDIAAKTMGPVRVNRFKVGDTVNDFSLSGMHSALSANGIPMRRTGVDIGIMQKVTERIEDGVTWYYTGAYSWYFNCIIKSRDFVTWEYVAAPDFPCFSLWENAVYVLGSRVFYFVRQDDCRQGFLTCYDLEAKTWSTPCLIEDSQSRADFIVYRDQLYLIHSPRNREGFGIVRVDTEDISRSVPVLVADMGSSLFYPFTQVYGDEVYISYTVARQHIRLSKFRLNDYLM